VLEARAVCHAVGDRRLVDGVSFTLAAGGVLGIVGPNGAGKTTLLRLCTGYLRPSAGGVYLGGERVDRMAPVRLARLLAYVPQAPRADLTFTVLDTVLLGRFAHGPAWHAREREADVQVARRALAEAGVAHLADRPFHTLSGGERQRVVLARALAQEPRVLLLDEPTANLDPRYQLSVLETVRRLADAGAAAAVALHDLTLAARYCDNLLLLAGGRVVAVGPPEEVLRPELLREVYGVRVWVERHPRLGHLVVLPVG